MIDQDTLTKPIVDDESASDFLAAFVDKANNALYSWYSQVGPFKPTEVYDTVMKMEQEGRINITNPSEQESFELSKKILKAFSECYEITAALKKEIDDHMTRPDVKQAVEIAQAAEELQSYSGRVN